MFAGTAGAVVINAHQTVFATGVVVALALIPTRSIFGMAVVVGGFGIAALALERWAVEVACVLVTSGLFFAGKRAIARRRAHS